MKKLTKNVANVANAELYACEMCDRKSNYTKETRDSRTKTYNFIVGDLYTLNNFGGQIGSVAHANNAGHFHIKVTGTNEIYAYNVDFKKCENVFVKSWKVK